MVQGFELGAQDCSLLWWVWSGDETRLDYDENNTKVPFAKYAENREARVKPHKEVVVFGSQSHSKTGKRQYKDGGTCKS